MLIRLFSSVVFIFFILAIAYFIVEFLRHVYQKWKQKKYVDAALLLIIFITFWIVFGGGAFFVLLMLGSAAHVPFLPYSLA